MEGDALVTAGLIASATYLLWGRQIYRFWGIRRPFLIAFIIVQVLSALECCVLPRATMLQGWAWLSLLAAHKIAYAAASAEALWKISSRREPLAVMLFSTVICALLLQSLHPLGGDSYRALAVWIDLWLSGALFLGMSAALASTSLMICPERSSELQAVTAIALAGLGGCRSVTTWAAALLGNEINHSWAYPLVAIALVIVLFAGEEAEHADARRA